MPELRHFCAAAGVLAVMACSPIALAADEAAAVQQAIKDNYAAYSGFEEQKYRATLADDYLLLENGELIDREGDVASMAKAGTGHRRSDTFDFRQVRVQGDIAYAVYFLTSDLYDDIRGSRHREWLESAVFRRSSNCSARSGSRS